MLDSHKWNPGLKEFPDDPGSVGVETDGATRMLAALAQDRYGIAYAGLVYNHPDVTALPIAETAGDPFIAPSAVSVANRSYPLTRIISMFVNKPPGERLAPHIEEFMRYILSTDGQLLVEQDGHGYLPLSADIALRELEKLND